MLDDLLSVLDIDARTEVAGIDAAAVEGVDMRISHPLNLDVGDP